VLLMAQGDLAAAETLLRESAEVTRAVLGDGHPQYAFALNGIGWVRERQGQLADAQDWFERALTISQATLGDRHGDVLTIRLNLARVRLALGHAAVAERELRDVLAARQDLYGAADWRVGQAQSLLAASLLALSRPADAEPLMLAADALLGPVPGRQAEERAANRARLEAFYRQRGDTQRASAFR
jgi:tetratricopeptide (TPR) repeat protein